MDALFDLLQPPPVFMDTHGCKHCGGEEIVMDGLLTCKSCFSQTPYLDYDKPSMNHQPEIANYAYKRTTHFREVLNQFQGKEITTIPEYILELVRNQDATKVTYETTRDILRANGLKRFHEHITYINAFLFKVKALFIPIDIEEKLCALFTRIQAPYNKCRPDARNNFLSYHFILKKLLEIVNFTTFNHHLRLIKDKKKSVNQTAIWNEICEMNNWIK